MKDIMRIEKVLILMNRLIVILNIFLKENILKVLYWNKMLKDCNLLFIDIFIFVVMIVLLLFLLKIVYWFLVLFCKLKDYNIVVDIIKSEGVVLFIGKFGSGKIIMVSFIVKIEFKEYIIIYMKFKEINVLKVNIEKIFILWDDCLGVWNMINRIDDWMFEVLIWLI